MLCASIPRQSGTARSAVVCHGGFVPSHCRCSNVESSWDAGMVLLNFCWQYVQERVRSSARVWADYRHDGLSTCSLLVHFRTVILKNGRPTRLAESRVVYKHSCLQG